MKKIPLLAFVFPFYLTSMAQARDGQWDLYMANYENGPGSTLLDMSLKSNAPYKELPFLLKAGVHFKGCTSEGLPEDLAFNRLHEISDSAQACIAKNFNYKLAGTFTYKCTRTDYYYIQDTANARKMLQEIFDHNFKNEDCFVEIKMDTAWQAYREFLSPNEETQEYMSNSKVVMQLQGAGDKLVRARQVDHWAYFQNAKDRQGFTNYITGKGFKIEKADKTTKGKLPYSLQFSRLDKVDLPSISLITLELRKQAKKNNGEYDGWESVVIKE